LNIEQYIIDNFEKARDLHNDGKYAQSNKILLELLKVSDNINIKVILAMNYLYLQEYAKAFEFINTALLVQPNDGFCNYILGEIYFGMRDISKSIECYTKSLQYSPQDYNAHNGLAKCYDDINDIVKLKKHLYNSLSLNKNQLGVIKKLAYIKGKEKNYSKSIQYYRYAISIGDCSDIYHLLALAYNHINEYLKAIYYFHKSINSFASGNDEVSRICYYNLGISYHKLGYLDRAKKSYLHTLSIDPYDVKANWSLAVLYLLQGDFENGWKKYEWRRKMPFFHHRTHGLLENVPHYNGQNLDNKILSIHSEQGYGDTIQFVRMISFVLKTTNVKKIIFRTHTPLYELMKQFNSSRCEVYQEGYKYVKGVKADYQIALMSIPAFFDFSFNYISSKAYIKSIKTIPLSLDFDKLNIGIAWAGNSQNTNNSLRSIELDLFDDILNNEKINFYSLHLKDINEDINRFGYSEKITDLSLLINDFCDTSCIINQLDLVISVDTVIAHLAGAMGIKTFVLLQYSPDFRWLLNRNDSPWYDSVKLFRQEKFGDYSKPIQDISLEITQMISSNKEALSS